KLLKQYCVLYTNFGNCATDRRRCEYTTTPSGLVNRGCSCVLHKASRIASGLRDGLRCARAAPCVPGVARSEPCAARCQIPVVALPYCPPFEKKPTPYHTVTG